MIIIIINTDKLTAQSILKGRKDKREEAHLSKQCDTNQPIPGIAQQNLCTEKACLC